MPVSPSTCPHSRRPLDLWRILHQGLIPPGKPGGRPFLSAQSRLLQQLCPKWSGSWEAVHAFGRECMLSAEPGGLGAVIAAVGHLERWLDLGGGSEGEHYLRRPEVHQEIVEAAGRSVLHPSYRPGYKWLYAHSVFAMALSLIGDHYRAAPHFRALGNRASKYPWAYLNDPAGEFVRHRTAALGRA